MTAEATQEIDNPRLWRLGIELTPKMLHIVRTSTVADASLRRTSIPLSGDSYLKSLEEAVYATPDLLADYGRIYIVVRTDAFTVIPRTADDEFARLCADGACLADDDVPSEMFIDDAEAAKVAWTMPADVAGFLARTFRNAPMHSIITPLIRFFVRRTAMGNSAKLFAHIDGRYLDIVAFSPDGRLMAAVTHTIETDTDALYFIMACARDAGMDPLNDEILLCGDPDRRLSLMPLLSRYAARVMPIIFPSAALRAGREAFKAPFPLIILPLCE